MRQWIYSKDIEREDLLKTISLLCRDILGEKGAPTPPLGNLLLRPPSPLFRAYNRFIRRKGTDLYSSILKRIKDLRNSIRESLGVKRESGEIRFILRVDDFPRWDIPSKEFISFHRILSRHRIPYLLGITPSISLDPLNPQSRKYRPLSDEEETILKEITADGVEFALHGLTHQTRTRRGPRSELIGLSDEELEGNIQRGLNELSKIYPLPPIIFFIPPFNTLNLNNCQVLARYFLGICAGREAIPYVGFRITPSFLCGILYIPSYEPVYGYAGEILEYLEAILPLKENIIVPITLHWSWELEDRFSALESLAEKIRGRTLRWNSLIGQDDLR